MCLLSNEIMAPMLTCYSLWKGHKHHYSIHHVVPHMIFHIQSLPPRSNAELWSCQCRNPLHCPIQYAVYSPSGYSVPPTLTPSITPVPVMFRVQQDMAMDRCAHIIAPVLSVPSLFHIACQNRSCTHTVCCVVYNNL